MVESYITAPELQEANSNVSVPQSWRSTSAGSKSGPKDAPEVSCTGTVAVFPVTGPTPPTQT